MSKKKKNNKKSMRIWGRVVTVALFAALFAFAGVYIKNYPVEKDVKLVGYPAQGLEGQEDGC